MVSRLFQKFQSAFSFGKSLNYIKPISTVITHHFFSSWMFVPDYVFDAPDSRYDHCDPNILGWAESKVKSPDQLEAGDWHFPAEDHKTQVPGLWPADPYVRCNLVRRKHNKKSVGRKPFGCFWDVFFGGMVCLKGSSNTPVESPFCERNCHHGRQIKRLKWMIDEM